MHVSWLSNKLLGKALSAASRHSEAYRPGKALQLSTGTHGLIISGTKLFCSGAGLLQRTLLTVGDPDPLLFDVDLFAHSQCMPVFHTALVARLLAGPVAPPVYSTTLSASRAARSSYLGPSRRYAPSVCALGAYFDAPVASSA